MKLANLFRTKKSLIFETACNYYRYIWQTAETVEFERENPCTDYVRLSGVINNYPYQVHINSAVISARVPNFFYKRVGRDNDTELIRIFALACACADFREDFRKFRTLAKSLVLNYSR